MHPRLALVITLALAAAAALSPAGFAPPAFAQNPPSVAASPQEVQSQIDDGNYKEALQKIASALAIRREAGKQIDRHQLYMLKAECHVRMKAPTLAVEAYANAVKEAREGKARNLAAAHELLFRKQRGLAYRPLNQEKGKPPVTIDIIDPASRRKAFAALFADELTALQPRLAAAKKATGLAPIFEAFKLIPRLEGLELASSESPQGRPPAPQTAKLLDELAEQSRKLIDLALRDMAKQVAAIDKEANQFKEIVREVPDPTVRSAYGVRYKIEKVYKKQGPSDANVKELETVTATCDQVVEASRMLAEGVPSMAKGFETLIAECDRLRKESDRILDADYTTTYKELPTKPPAKP